MMTRQQSRLLERARIGLVYGIGETPAGPLKIGHCSNLVARLSEIQIGNPNLLEAQALFAVESRYRREAEAAFHHAFIGQSIRGEWFAVSAADMAQEARAIEAFRVSDLTVHLDRVMEIAESRISKEFLRSL